VHSHCCQDGAAVAPGIVIVKDPFNRTQCLWTPPWLAKLSADRAAYERAGCPRAVTTGAHIEAELAEVERRRGRSR